MVRRQELTSRCDTFQKSGHQVVICRSPACQLHRPDIIAEVASPRSARSGVYGTGIAKRRRGVSGDAEAVSVGCDNECCSTINA